MPNRDSVFMLDVADDGLHVTTPASVLSIHSADELRQKLDAYSDPIKNKAIKNTAKDRRWYVEKILPALRFFCERYDVEVPGWLATNGHWDRLGEDEKVRLFGPEPIKMREFAPVERPDIEVQREEVEGGE